MDIKVKERLIVGLAQYLSAQSAGSARFAVADSYLSIDNYFSAILIDEGIDPPRNHKRKLNIIFSDFEELFRKAEITKDDVEQFYDCWQKVRYSSAIPTPNEAHNFIRLSYRIISVIMQEIAHRYGKSANELEEELYSEVLGTRWLSFEKECSYIHEMWQQEAEILGEMGIGSKLGNKMLNPSNFCEIYVLTDDPVTRKILANDSKIGAIVAKFYQSFLKLVVEIQNIRYEQGIESYEIPNFMLSLRLRYHGQSMEEIAKDWSNMIAEVINRMNNQSLDTQNNEDNV